MALSLGVDMSQASGVARSASDEVTGEDILRAQAYRLLARFLSSAPAADDLRVASALSGDGGAFGQAISAFGRMAQLTTAQAAAEEYQTLFIGLVRGELVPYGSYYLTGFLHEKPLAKLRSDMRRLGIVREEGVHEPEDHIASLCEMMAGLIDGSFGEPLPLEAQKLFYKTHIGSWASVFFRDLEIAKSSMFYAALGAVGRQFIAIEDMGFEMV